MRPLETWFRITFDDEGAHVQASPEGGEAWEMRFRWADVSRVCFEGAGLFDRDSVYIFLAGREESLVIPAEIPEGQALWQELIRRGLFDAQLAIEAAIGEGLRCWPPPPEEA